MTEADRPASGRASARRLRFGAGGLLLALGGALTAVAATQGPAGAGGPSPDKTIPTLPPASGDVAATATVTSVTDSSVTDSSGTETSGTETSVTDSTVTGSTPTDSSVVAPASTVADVDTGIPLSAGAGPAELFAAANRALESDADIAAGLAGFAVIPTGIPTPAGASINTISVSYSAEAETYVATAEFTTSAESEDVVVYYQTVLTAEGFSSTRDETRDGVRSLEFAPPSSSGSGESDSDDSFVRLSIDSTDGVAVGIEITDHAEAAALEAFAGWPAGLPGLTEGRPTEAHITATREGATTVTMSTTFAYDGTSADALTTLIRDGLATRVGGFQIADDDEGGTAIALDHTIIDDVVASITDADGVTLLRVDGSIALG